MSVVIGLEAIALAASIGLAISITRIAVRNWKGDRYLCDDCRFNDPEKCLKTERPKAVDCAAYQKT